MEDLPIDIDTAIPLGLIMTELVSNSLKYAFPEGRGGEIRITGSTEDDGTFRFTVSDNGVGIPETIDWRNTDSLGLRLVNSLVTQLNGTIDLDRTGGTSFTFIVHPKEER
jgi:two-component sensor histidine kinase